MAVLLAIVRIVAMALAVLLALAVVTLPPEESHAASLGDISGEVTTPEGGLPDGPVMVTVEMPWPGPNLTAAVDESTGQYRFEGLAPGSYRMLFTYSGLGRYVSVVHWPDAYDRWGADLVWVTADQTTIADFVLISGAEVTGNVVTDDGVDTDVRPYFKGYGPNTVDLAGDFVDESGDFRMVVPAGEYYIAFGGDPQWTFEYWDDAPTPGQAQRVVLTAGGALGNVNAHLLRATSIGGNVLYDDGSGNLVPRSGTVTAMPVEGGNPWIENIDSSGRYDLEGIPAGTYRVCFSVVIYFQLPSCHGGTVETATLVTVEARQALNGIDGVVFAAGAMQISLYGQDTIDEPLHALPQGVARLWRLDETSGTFVLEREVDVPSGDVTVTALPFGSYIVELADESGNLPTEYYYDQPSFALADLIDVSGPYYYQVTHNILGPPGVKVYRVTGRDRFETSVEISQAMYGEVPAEGIPVLYIANGLNYPDALAAGPAAIAGGGVVLLSYPWALPPVVKAELERLRPQRVVVVGGNPSIDGNVLAQIEGLAFAPEVDRLTGTDRFGTSRAIALDTFPAGAETAFLATGLNYPDALAAGPAAGSVGAPIILVNGMTNSLDEATRSLLESLGVTQVYIIGGSPSVSEGIESDLRIMLGSSSVKRLTGADRFGTAGAISREFYDSAELAFLSTGLNFPDALAGGPLAAAFGAPLLLSRQDCIQSDVLENLADLDVNGLVLLGGDPSLSENVEMLGRC